MGLTQSSESVVDGNRHDALPTLSVSNLLRDFISRGVKLANTPGLNTLLDPEKYQLFFLKQQK